MKRGGPWLRKPGSRLTLTLVRVRLRGSASVTVNHDSEGRAHPTDLRTVLTGVDVTMDLTEYYINEVEQPSRHHGSYVDIGVAEEDGQEGRLGREDPCIRPRIQPWTHRCWS